jgi:hypothetical protein
MAEATTASQAIMYPVPKKLRLNHGPTWTGVKILEITFPLKSNKVNVTHSKPTTDKTTPTCARRGRKRTPKKINPKSAPKRIRSNPDEFRRVAKVGSRATSTACRRLERDDCTLPAKVSDPTKGGKRIASNRMSVAAKPTPRATVILD